MFRCCDSAGNERQLGDAKDSHFLQLLVCLTISFTSAQNTEEHIQISTKIAVCCSGSCEWLKSLLV